MFSSPQIGEAVKVDPADDGGPTVFSATKIYWGYFSSGILLEILYFIYRNMLEYILP